MRTTSVLMAKIFFTFVTGIVALILGALTMPVMAQSGVAQGAQNNIKARLVAETRVPAPGSTIMLAIDMQPEKGWHGYWKNPGDAGFPADLKWTLPQGASVGAVRFPVPERLIVQGLMNHVFNGPHALLIPITLPKSGLSPGTRLPIRMTGDWLACTDKVCVPERATLSLDLKIGNGLVTPQSRAQFDAWRMNLPKPLGTPAHFAIEGDTARIAIPYPAGLPADDAWFFAATEKAVGYLGPQKVKRSGDMLIIETRTAGFGFAAPTRLDGVLAVKGGTSTRGLIGFDVSATPGRVAVDQANSITAILVALGGAIIGGLILNIMPCVFPIISLKAMGLARAGGNEREAKREAVAYSAGVILTCLSLGGALLALRSGGTQVGWAFQLQDPRVILALLILTTAIALNMAGLFHLRAFGGGQGLTDKGGAAGAFWTGALAAFVATPCTGPFMAAALGAALVLPTLAALAIFAGLGFGLALPFILLAFIPALRKRMPKPGPWMVTFQRWMAVPMMLTAAALAWLLWRQTGGTGLIIGGGAVIVAAALLTIVRTRQPLGVSFGVLLAGVGVVTAVAIPFLPSVAQRARATMVPGTEAFSQARLDQRRKEGRPVFLYFTADWCVTCKVNEKAAIERADVEAAFKANKTVVMVGDWTNGDPAISRFLEAQGRSGVPLYLYYPGGNNAARAMPITLPQVLTPTMLVNLGK
jgi:DsbC/DsbD-like thiol-disulfide interchange protein/cytochrome c biogenesis protein CcdA